MAKKRKPEAPIGLNKFLTSDEERRFMEYMVSVSGDEGGVQNCLIFDLMLQTGLRVSELCGLRAKDTPKYLGANAIHVHESKGQKSRDIPISDRLAARLSDYLKNYRPATLPQTVRASDRRKQVFYSALKQPYKRAAIAHKLKKFTLLAGLDKHVTPHMTRHTFATLSLFENRLNTKQLQALLGHSKLATTEMYLYPVGLLNPEFGNNLDRGRWVY
ncbi:hypothetical protein LCGC14_0403200 [marine sediment metagenome]|uniref:Tyr recombinase domain-containing protein n=1 Tax=marine sediment metagenome TaxID=412755 RepID=A0A0F9W519_9ZZZZ